MRAALRSLGAAAVLLAAVPSVAAAHPDTVIPHGFLHGFEHPLSGWDHLLAMFAVGLWAAQRGGRAVWVLPLTFVAVMVGAGAIAMSGAALPGVEAGILASVFVLGLVIALAARVPGAAALALIALFAAFHGAAHGSEMPAGVGGVTYAAGFATATAALHLAGAFLGISLQRGLREPHQVWVRVAGASVCAAGLAFLILGI
ncbi:MAG TPA: HupE/UreJ family protein [Longimicrobiales bacterium]